MGVTADSRGSSVWNAVDLYTSASGTWSTAQLSVARESLAATSVGNVAIFAGGSTQGNCILTLFVEGLLFWLMSVGDAVTCACLRRVACFLLCLRCRRLPSDGGHCRWSSSQCCGPVQLYFGQINNCSSSAINISIRSINDRSRSTINISACGCCGGRICGRRRVRRSAGGCRVALAEIHIPGTQLQHARAGVCSLQLIFCEGAGTTRPCSRTRQEV